MASQIDQEASRAYEEEFLTILNNRDKSQQGSGVNARKKGFVVLARGDDDLEPIQALCSRDRQTWNTCLTARYRLRGGPTFGTLFSVFMSDLRRIQEGSIADIQGNFSPSPSEPEWKEFVSGPLEDRLGQWPEEDSGTLDQSLLGELFKSLSDETTLRAGQRLVLLGEIGEIGAIRSEWDQAKTELFGQLPERFGLVLSGAPDDFRLLTNDPHYLEIVLPTGPPPVETSHRFRPASLHSDLPASEDSLGVNKYARALARFVLHKQTQPPLALGVHGRWGKGKTSFMRLVDSALIKEARVNRGARADALAGLQQEVRERESELEAAATAEKPQLEKELKEKSARAERLWQHMRRDARAEVLTVSFNAWQFEDAEQIWAGLASEVTGRLERALPWRSRGWMRLRYAWKKRRSELLLSLLFPILIALLAGWYAVSRGSQQLSQLLHSEEPIEELSYLLLFAGPTLSLLGYIAWRTLKVIQPVSERVLSYIQLPNYREQMGYQHLVMDDLRFAYSHLQRHWRECRVVVFIDDLDRCSEEKIMEILQAINLILGNGKFFVFLGMDTEMIYRAIRTYYSQHEKAEPLPDSFPEDYLRKIVQLSFYLPATPDTIRLAFLDTLFSPAARRELGSPSGTISDPKPPGPDVSFARALLVTLRSTVSTLSARIGAILARIRTRGREVDFSYDLAVVQPPREPQTDRRTEEVEDTPDELQAFRAYEPLLGDNPRETKHLVNVHRFVKIVLQGQDTVWPEDRQRKLVKWLFFCTLWPDLVDDVLAFVKDEPLSPNCLAGLSTKLASRTSQAQVLERLKDFATKLASLVSDAQRLEQLKDLATELASLSPDSETLEQLKDLTARLASLASDSETLEQLKDLTARLASFSSDEQALRTLKDFSEKDDVLSSKDIDSGFREAAEVTQFIREEAAT